MKAAFVAAKMTATERAMAAIAQFARNRHYVYDIGLRQVRVNDKIHSCSPVDLLDDLGQLARILDGIEDLTLTPCQKFATDQEDHFACFVWGDTREPAPHRPLVTVFYQGPLAPRFWQIQRWRELGGWEGLPDNFGELLFPSWPLPSEPRPFTPPVFASSALAQASQAYHLARVAYDRVRAAPLPR